MRIRIREPGKWPKFTNKHGFLPLGFCRYLLRYDIFFDVKIQLFVSLKSDQDPDPDPHWFASLDLDPQWDKKLDTDPRIQNTAYNGTGYRTVPYRRTSMRCLNLNGQNCKREAKTLACQKNWKSWLISWSKSEYSIWNEYGSIRLDSQAKNEESFCAHYYGMWIIKVWYLVRTYLYKFIHLYSSLLFNKLHWLIVSVKNVSHDIPPFHMLMTSGALPIPKI